MLQKIKTAILIILGLLIIWFVWVSLTTSRPRPPAPAQNNQAAQEPQPDIANGDLNAPPPPPVFQTSERQFAVISAKENVKDTYQARDLASNQEVDVFIPSDAIITAGRRADIKAGTILTVQRFMELSNGVVAAQLSISTKE